MFGLLKEFSSITLVDVRTVAVDCSTSMLDSSPFVEIVTLAASDSKFTICSAQELSELVSQNPADIG